MKASLSLLLLLCFIETHQAREASFPLPVPEEVKYTTVSELDAQYECALIVKYDNNPAYSVTAIVRNTGSSVGKIMTAELELDSGLYLASGQSSLIQMGVLLQPGDTAAAVSWTVRPIVRIAPGKHVVGVVFFDSTGNAIVCRDSIDIPADPKVELTLNCSSDLTELVADPVRGGYVQDSVEIRLRINNTGELTAYDLEAIAIPLDNLLKITGGSQPGRISRLDPGAPAVEMIWRLKAGPRKTDDTACILILVTGNDPDGSRIPTLECTVCIWIPKASIVTGLRRPMQVGANTLEQNRPNPFNPVTAIDYTLATDSHVRITVYDIFGRRIATLADERATAGAHSVDFSSNGLPAGVYFYGLDASGMSVIRRMVVAR
ncbi:MAG: T9SS type A sorting domain-containing protein [Bacteroidota bacterium]|jgi:hypothetical protein